MMIAEVILASPDALPEYQFVFAFCELKEPSGKYGSHAIILGWKHDGSGQGVVLEGTSWYQAEWNGKPSSVNGATPYREYKHCYRGVYGYITLRGDTMKHYIGCDLKTGKPTMAMKDLLEGKAVNAVLAYERKKEDIPDRLVKQLIPPSRFPKAMTGKLHNKAIRELMARRGEISNLTHKKGKLLIPLGYDATNAVINVHVI